MRSKNRGVTLKKKQLALEVFQSRFPSTRNNITRLKLEAVKQSPPVCNTSLKLAGGTIQSKWFTFPSDRISRFLQRGGYFQPEQIKYILQRLSWSHTKPNFFDLGTNIGTESVPVAKLVKALGGEVLGIDANPRNAALGI